MAILQQADVNIASMNVARAVSAAGTSNETTEEAPTAATTSASSSTAGSRALCFMSLDDDVSTKAMNSLLSLPFLHSVAKIQLK